MSERKIKYFRLECKKAQDWVGIFSTATSSVESSKTSLMHYHRSPFDDSKNLYDESWRYGKFYFTLAFIIKYRGLILSDLVNILLNDEVRVKVIYEDISKEDYKVEWEGISGHQVTITSGLAEDYPTNKLALRKYLSELYKN